MLQTSPTKHFLAATFLCTLAFGNMVFPPAARSQDDALSAGKATPNFSRLAVSPANLSFRQIKFPPGPAFEDAQLKISNSGKGSTSLHVTVAPATGSGAAGFKILSGEGALPALAPNASATVTVRFQPVVDGAAAA